MYNGGRLMHQTLKNWTQDIYHLESSSTSSFDQRKAFCLFVIFENSLVRSLCTQAQALDCNIQSGHKREVAEQAIQFASPPTSETKVSSNFQVLPVTVLKHSVVIFRTVH